MRRTFLFATIASILSINAFAVSATVTSKDYVDAADEAIYDYVDDELAGKQDLIETEIDSPWYRNYSPVTLVTANNPDSGTEGVVGNEFGILNRDWLVDNYIYDDEGIVSSLRALHSDEDGFLLERSTVPNTVIVAEMAEEIHEKADKMTCAGWPDGVAHTDANCWLWNKN